ncbi:hypothetical protein B0H11DRAFT_2261321 [Mycena galericulata]|nr:hypothetical protein B0H11DRAFT_2261321 [Mycena galericulata]
MSAEHLPYITIQMPVCKESLEPCLRRRWRWSGTLRCSLRTIGLGNQSQTPTLAELGAGFPRWRAWGRAPAWDAALDELRIERVWETCSFTGAGQCGMQYQNRKGNDMGMIGGGVLKTIGLSKRHVAQTCQLVAAILHLGPHARSKAHALFQRADLYECEDGGYATGVHMVWDLSAAGTQTGFGQERRRAASSGGGGACRKRLPGRFGEPNSDAGADAALRVKCIGALECLARYAASINANARIAAYPSVHAAHRGRGVACRCGANAVGGGVADLHLLGRAVGGNSRAGASLSGLRGR